LALRASSVVGVMAMTLSASAQAVVYDFDHQVWGDSSIQLVNDAGRQVFVEVTENLSTVANDVLFRFTNTIPPENTDPDGEASIINLYFDVGNYTDLFTGMAISEQSTGVLLTMPGDRPTMSGTNSSFDATFDEAYSVGRGSGHPANQTLNGINPGQYLVMTGTLGDGKSFSDVVNAMNVGIDDDQVVAQTGLRISNIIHRIWGVAADSDHGAFVTANVVAVPEAETWAMLLAGLGLVGFMTRRRLV
jgi:hypothetical protein